MTKLKLILMAILTIFARLFALPTSAARRGFSIMRSPLPNCRWLAVCLLGTTLTLSGCGPTIPEMIKENCGYLRSANTCEKAKDYLRCVADNGGGRNVYVMSDYLNAQDNVEIECGDKNAGKGSPYQQVCPAGAACNQGVK